MYLDTYLLRETAERDADAAVAGTNAEYAGTDWSAIMGGRTYDCVSFFGEARDLEIVAARLDVNAQLIKE